MLTVVPVAHPAEIKMAHVGARDLTDDLAILLKLTPEVVLFFEIVAVVRYFGFDIVLLVPKGLLTEDLVAERSHEQTVHLVFRVVVRDTAT